MSGIYISGMEVPKEAGTYRIEFDQCGNPYLLSENGDLGLWHIISVPAHGRLGDLDELSERVERSRQKNEHTNPLTKSCHDHEHDHFQLMISTAPTIIPADKEEQI